MRLRFLLVAASSFLGTIAFAQDDLESLTQELRGGHVITGFAGVVEVSTADGSCTGSMIGPRTVLTAAHCVGSGPNGSGSFKVYYHDPEIGRRIVFDGTADWFADPQHSPNGIGTGARVNHDIALVRIPGVFRATNYRDYLRLYADTGSRLKTTLTAYGAGKHTYSGRSDDNLRRHWFSVESVKKNHIVVDTRKKVGLCVGDSGGPLVFDIRDSSGPVPVVAGVLSASDVDPFNEGEVCTNNDLGIDDAWYSRSNWEKLGPLTASAGIRCVLLETEGVSYRRCFALPFVESVDFEGLDRGSAAGIVVSSIL